MFWRRKTDDEAATYTAAPGTDLDPPETAAPETDLDAPETAAPETNLDAPDADASDLELEPEPAAESGVDPSEPEAVSDPEHLADLVAAVGALPEPVAAPPAPAEPDTTPRPAQPEGDLDAGLARTRGGFMSRLRGFLGSGGPDEASWDDVAETLIGGDVGASLAMEVVERARRRREPGGAEAAVRAELAALLVTRDPDWTPRPSVAGGPAVILVVGVNGTGKTTTIGKLAARYAGEGRSVLLAAADTFRAAAIDQLRIWAERADVPVVAHAPHADPGAVVYDALDAAVARGADLVIADTAGRLHTKSNLMDELAKIRRIIDKRLPGAEPETIFVLDATTGQNGLAQAKAFHESVGLTGIVLTKLDSTAKGGIVFAIEHDLGVPVRFVGVGEKVGDLLPFDPDAFVAALFA